MERYLTAFLKEKLLSADWSIQSNRKDFPLRFVFANDLTNQERRYVVDLFVKAGYRNVAEITIEETLFAAVASSTRTKLVLSGLGGDLYMSLYSNASATCKNCKMLPDIGTDPRYLVCADKIFEEIRKINPWMLAQKENNIDVLIAEAGKVLQTKNPIYLGNIIFDTGEGGDFQINIAALNNQLNHSQQSLTMITELEYFLRTEALQPHDVDVILEGGVNTDYFADRLHEKFPTVFNLSLSDYVKIWNRVFAIVDLNPPVIQEAEGGTQRQAPTLPPIMGRVSSVPPLPRNDGRGSIIPPIPGTPQRQTSPKAPTPPVPPPAPRHPTPPAPPKAPAAPKRAVPTPPSAPQSAVSSKPVPPTKPKAGTSSAINEVSESLKDISDDIKREMSKMGDKATKALSNGLGRLKDKLDGKQ